MQALYLCLVLSVSGVGLVFLVEWSWHANRSSKIHRHAHLQCPLQNLTMRSNVKIGPFVCICLLPARLFACGEIGMWLICSRATLSGLNSTLEEENLFSVSATKSALLLFLVWERVVSPVENPKLPLIALHGGAAVAAAGINGISVYGVKTPTLPMDKRCHWTPVTNCAASSSTTNCSLSMWSRSCPLEYASCRAFQSSILKCRLLYSC